MGILGGDAILMLANQYEGATSMTRAICLSGKREFGT